MNSSDEVIGANGGPTTASGSDSTEDRTTENIDLIRELTVTPFISGVLQGFVSVWFRYRRERREAANKTAELKMSHDPSRMPEISFANKT